MPDTPSEWVSGIGGVLLWLTAAVAWWWLARAVVRFRCAQKNKDDAARELEKEKAHGELVAATLGDPTLVSLAGLGLFAQAAAVVLSLCGL